MMRYLILAAAVLTAPLLCGGIRKAPDPIREKIPDWVTLNSMDEDVTIDTGSGTENVHVTLKNGAFQITGENMQFTTDSEWYVADCFFCDLDKDGADEVMLHFWKPGSFGQYQPFWREPDDKEAYSEHIFIYDWNTQKEDRLKIIWGSSKMAYTGKKIWTDEQNLIHLISVNDKETVWRWNYFGLELLDEEDLQ